MRRGWGIMPRSVERDSSSGGQVVMMPLLVIAAMSLAVHLTKILPLTCVLTYARRDSRVNLVEFPVSGHLKSAYTRTRSTMLGKCRLLRVLRIRPPDIPVPLFPIQSRRLYLLLM